MFKSPAAVIPLAGLLLAACTGSSGPAVEAATEPTANSEATANGTAEVATEAPGTEAAALGTADSPPKPAGESCGATVRSSLPGVSLHFPDQPCTLTLAQAKSHSFPWTLVVDEAPGKLAHTTLHNCQGLRESGFHPREKLHGNQQRYELADSGRCRDPELFSSPVQGTFAESFDWDGVNWTGPSDFGNPKGKLFPPGTYTFLVEMRGTHKGTEWEIVGEMPFTLTGVATEAPKRGEGPGAGGVAPTPEDAPSTEPVGPIKPLIRHPVIPPEEKPPTPG